MKPTYSDPPHDFRVPFDEIAYPGVTVLETMMDREHIYLVALGDT